jgi:hypothetical protein
MICAINPFQWRGNGANPFCSIIKSALRKTNGALGLRHLDFPMARLWRNGAPKGTARSQFAPEMVLIRRGGIKI